jgi:hypothetical protein
MGIADRHHFVDGRRDLPNLNARAVHHIGRRNIVHQVVFAPAHRPLAAADPDHANIAFGQLRLDQERAGHIRERTEKGDMQWPRVVLHSHFDDETRAGRIRCGLFVRDRPLGALLDAHLAAQRHEIKQLHHLVVAVLHRRPGFDRTEVSRNDPVQLETGRQQALDDGILVIGLVLGIGVDDDAGQFVWGQ